MCQITYEITIWLGEYTSINHTSYDLEYQRCQGFDPEPFPIITMMGIPKQHGPTQILW